MTCGDRKVILKWTGPWWTPESSTPRYHQHYGDSRKSPGVGRLDPQLGERAGDAVAVLSRMPRDVQVTGRRRAVPPLAEQARIPVPPEPPAPRPLAPLFSPSRPPRAVGRTRKCSLRVRSSLLYPLSYDGLGLVGTRHESLIDKRDQS
jgi:hypothetical protein